METEETLLIQKLHFTEEGLVAEVVDADGKKGSSLPTRHESRTVLLKKENLPEPELYPGQFQLSQTS